MGAQCSAPQPHVAEAKHHLEDSFGQDASAAISELAAVLKGTNDLVFRVPLKHPPIVDLGMIATQCLREQRHAKPSTSGKSFTDITLLMRAGRYAKYAQAAYHNSQEDILKAIQGEDLEDFGGNVDILHVEMASKEVGFFIAVDKGTSDIVLSVRGKVAAHEALTLVAGQPAPFSGGSAPEALLDAATKLVEAARKPLEEAFARVPGSFFAVVGHGIGAGVAVLATLGGFGEGSTMESMVLAHKAKCYAFGSPPVYEPAGELPEERSAAIFSFVRGADMVPRLCPASIGKLLMAVRKVDELDMDILARMRFLRGEGDQAVERFPDCEDVPEELAGEFKQLELVGTRILLLKGAGGRAICEHLPAEYADKILLHEDMAKDHAMAGYEELIQETLMQLQMTKGCC